MYSEFYKDSIYKGRTIETKEFKIVLRMGLIGIMAVILTIISDFILIGRSNSAIDFLKLGTESMAGLSQWRITVGTFLGVIAIPFQIAGLATVYYALKPAGKFKALTVVISTAHALMLAVGFHIAYAYIASGWKLYYETGASDLIVAEMMKMFDNYWLITLIIMGIEAIFSSLLYIIAIMKYETLYPKWMAFLNPVCILICVFVVMLVLPYPIGGFIAPAFLNISTLIFFTSQLLIVKSTKV